jgi:sRNA-binding protein
LRFELPSKKQKRAQQREEKKSAKKAKAPSAKEKKHEFDNKQNGPNFSKIIATIKAMDLILTNSTLR